MKPYNTADIDNNHKMNLTLENYTINIAIRSFQRVSPGSPSLGGRKPGNIIWIACDLQGSRGFKSLSRRLIFPWTSYTRRPTHKHILDGSWLNLFVPGSPVAFPLLKRINVMLVLILFIGLADDKPLKRQGHKRLLQSLKLPLKQLKHARSKRSLATTRYNSVISFTKLKLRHTKRKIVPRSGEA